MAYQGCDDPGTPTNGMKNILSSYYENGDFLNFICFRGYELEGSSTILCMNGQWSDAIPQCIGEPAPGTTVDCGATDVTVQIRKDFVDDVDGKYLQLRDSSCRPDENSTHVTFTFGVGMCGSTVSEEGDKITYGNWVKTPPVPASAVIRRYPDVEIAFTCEYFRKFIIEEPDGEKKSYIVSDGHDKIEHSESHEGKISGIFDFYSDDTFTQLFDNATIETGLRDKVYFGIHVEGIPNERQQWLVRTDKCRGSSSPDPRDETAVQYSFLEDGCPVDDTLKVYPNDDPLRENFGIEAFRFKDYSINNQVYIHCVASICNVNDSDSNCNADCESGPLTRRSVRKKTDGVSVDLPKGHLYIKGGVKDTSIGGKKPVLAGLYGVVGFVLLVGTITCAAVFIIYRRRTRGIYHINRGSTNSQVYIPMTSVSVQTQEL
ncbi:ZP domain-containing protein-like [Glandiceps talaboti]